MNEKPAVATSPANITGTGVNAPRKRRFGLGPVIVIVIALAGITVVGLWGDKLKAGWVLQPWSSAGPRSGLTRFFDALQSNDAARIGDCITKGDLQVVEAEGTVRIQEGGGGAGGAPIMHDPRGLVPTQSVDQATYYYKYVAEDPLVAAELLGSDNTKIVYFLRHADGAWKIQGLHVMPADAKRGKHWQF